MMAQRILQNDQESEVRDAFRVFPKDKDGNIPMSELKYVCIFIEAKATVYYMQIQPKIVLRFVLSHIGLDQKDVDQMLHEADLNGDGQISYDGVSDVMT